MIVSGVSPPGSIGAGVGTGGSGGVVGGIVGGILGVLALVDLIVVFVLYRRRRRQRQQHSTFPVKANTDTGKPKSISLKHAGTAGSKYGDADYQEPQTFIPGGLGTNKKTASATVIHDQDPQGSIYGSAEGHHDPQSQGLQATSDIQLRLRELENQQKLIELKRLLLIFEEQEEALRPGSKYQQQQHQKRQYQQQVPKQYR